MRIELLGASFQIKSDESPEYLRRILDHVRARVTEIERTVATDDPLKKAILAAFLITDDLIRERDRAHSATDGVPDAGEIAAITSRLIERIDQIIPEAEAEADSDRGADLEVSD